MTPAEALIKGRDFLKNHNWGRGSYHDKSKNSYCAVGALFSGNFGEKYWERSAKERFEKDIMVVQDAHNYLSTAAQADGGYTVTGFNDNVAKRKRDVISLFNKAIKLAQG